MTRKFTNLSELSDYVDTLEDEGLLTFDTYQELVPIAARLARALPESLRGDALAFMGFVVRPEWPKLEVLAA